MTSRPALALGSPDRRFRRAARDWLPSGLQMDVEYPVEEIEPDQPAKVLVAVENGPTAARSGEV
jgi:hypothetical protein